jgi:predicted MPP superfamily phosphohydrolase
MRRRYAVLIGVFALLGGYAGLKAGLAFPAHLAAAAVAGLLPPAMTIAWQTAYRRGALPEEAAWARAWSWSVSILLGLWATFLILSVLGDAAALLRVPVPGAWLAGAAVLIASAGLVQALAGPRVRELEARLPGLPPGLDGLRVVQISDLHVGPTIRRALVSRVVDAALAARPDLIAVTGDLADGEPALLAPQVEPLGRLRAPLGAYFVTGNHEYYWDAPGWLEKTRELGLIPLVNESRVVERGGARLLVGGVPDEQGGFFVPGHTPDHAAAARGEADFRLLLAHRPDGAAAAERAGFGLQLSGHTHGGQFFPASLFIGLFHRHTRGISREGRMTVHVSPGTGFWGPAHRFAVPAEITVLTLRPA